MPDWNKVAYNNAYNLLKQGRPASSLLNTGATYKKGKFLPPMQAAINAFNRDKARSAKKKHTPAPAAAAPTPAPSSGGGEDKPNDRPYIMPEPTLEIPDLKFSEEASPEFQRQRILSTDSLPMQQARVKATERGVATGAIHGSQQEGAAMRAMSDVAERLGDKEATLAAGRDLTDWKAKVDKAKTVYQAKYSERLQALGIEGNLKAVMAQSNTALTQTLMNNISSMYSNNDFEVSQGAIDKLLSVIDTGQDNNNLILGMGFRY